MSDYNDINAEYLPVKRKMNLKLKSATPSGYPTSLLKSQMDRLKLTCPETDEKYLKEYIKEVMRDFRIGTRQVYNIKKTGANKLFDRQLVTADSIHNLCAADFFSALGMEDAAANGSWIVDDDAGGYRVELTTIVYEEHFDYLKNNFASDFPGNSSSKSDSIKEPTAAAIKSSFSNIAYSVCATVLSGIAEEDLKSVISQIIGNNQSTNVNDYKCDDVLNVFLINDYDPIAGSAVAVGVLSIKYKIRIDNYTSKSNGKGEAHTTAYIDVTSRFVSYSEESDMKRDIARVTSHFKNQLFPPMDNAAKLTEAVYGDIPIVRKKVEVYTSKPAATKEVFNTGLPLVNTGSFADVVIFYSPDIETVGCIDNTESSASASYSESVTSGFESSLGVTISSEASFELTFGFVKAGFKLGVSIALTSTWNQSHTETFEVTVPGGEIAYIYQGSLHHVTLRFDPKSNTYYYVNSSDSKFLSNAIKTSNIPVIKS